MAKSNKPARKDKKTADRQARSLAQRRARAAVAKLFQGPADREAVERALYGADRAVAHELLLTRLADSPPDPTPLPHFIEAFSVLGLDLVVPDLIALAQAPEMPLAARGFAYEVLAELTDPKPLLRPVIAKGDPDMLQRILTASAVGALLRGPTSAASRGRLAALLTAEPTSHGVDIVEAARAVLAQQASWVYGLVADRGLPAPARPVALDALVAEASMGALAVLDALLDDHAHHGHPSAPLDDDARAAYADARARLLARAADRPLPDGRAVASTLLPAGAYSVAVSLTLPDRPQPIGLILDLDSSYGLEAAATTPDGAELLDQALHEPARAAQVDLPTAVALFLDAMTCMADRHADLAVREVRLLLSLPARDVALPEPSASPAPPDPEALTALLDHPALEDLIPDADELPDVPFGPRFDEADRAAWVAGVRARLDEATLSALSWRLLYLARFFTFRGEHDTAALLAAQREALETQGLDNPVTAWGLSRFYDYLAITATYHP